MSNRYGLQNRTNPCENCALCCMDTEMPLSNKDIDLILNKSGSDLRREDFLVMNANGVPQLKNIDGHCFFLNPKTRMCQIYDFRPSGCCFYPIIYDLEKQKCVYDNDCPRVNLFRLSNKGFKNRCLKIKLFLKKDLKLPI
jgi:Fe-S-cluster containining protein